MIIRNSTIKGLNIDYKQLTELMEKSDFWEYTKNIDPMVYMQEAEDTLNKNIAFYDLDKMLLVAAYRAVEKANFEKLEAEEVKSIKSILAQIYMKLKGKNAKIQGEIPQLKTGEEAKIEYDLEKLKKDSFAGCYVNGEYILSPEEIAIEKQEIQRIKEEIASLFREQQEDQKDGGTNKM